ncbi:MAG TPA: MoaD/ThiS family protein [Verrucomicrobiae bacterium]|jgi:molybdopterin synthase sulfur carrier subunit|nr:MoaD/ThiS family protein [Verrucomicrobiae bacterium]
MKVTVSIPTAFRGHTEGLDHFACAATGLNDLLDALAARFPQLKPHLRDQEGKVRRFLNIYVNDEDIRFLGDNYSFHDGDEITLVPSIAGG